MSSRNAPPHKRLLKFDVIQHTEGGEQTNGSVDFENIFPGFRIQSEILTGFPGPANCSGLQIHPCFGPGLWTLRVIKIFSFAQISDSGRNFNSGLGNKL